MDSNLIYNPIKAVNFILKEDKWYNISTGRYNTKKYPKNKYSELYRVCGDFADVEEFERYHQNKKLEVSESKTRSFKTCCFPFLYKWRRRKMFKTGDVSKLELEDIENLKMYSFIGLSSKIKITHIIDGDTFDIILFIHANDLKNNNVIISKGDSYTFIKERIRLNSIDAAEKNTEKGKRIIEILKILLKNYDNILYAVFENRDLEGNLIHKNNDIDNGRDKFGRLLTTLYFDEKNIGTFENSVNSYILSVEDPELGHLALPYGGGTKTVV